MEYIATAKRDTVINLMADQGVEFNVSAGDWMFHITNENQTRFLMPGEIAVWSMATNGVCYGYANDWEIA